MADQDEGRAALILRRQQGMWVAGIASVGALVGSLLPWASVFIGFGTLDIAGTKGDGKLTLGVALFCLGMVLIQNSTAAVLGAIGMLIVAGIGVYDWSNVAGMSGVNSLAVNVDVGTGLIITALAGIVGIVGFGLLVSAYNGLRPAEERQATADTSYPPDATY